MTTTNFNVGGPPIELLFDGQPLVMQQHPWPEIPETYIKAANFINWSQAGGLLPRGEWLEIEFYLNWGGGFAEHVRREKELKR